MFASQLLRILQTLPADAKYEPRFNDAADLKGRETEKHYKKPSSMSLDAKDLLHSKDGGKVADPLILHARERDDFLNSNELEHSKVVDDLIINENCGNRISSINNNPSENLYHSNRNEKVEDALTSDEEDTGGLWNPPELECPLIMDEYANPNEHEPWVSTAPFVTSESFHADKNLFTDKNVLDYELPELIVCYKEISYHGVKDTLVDDGIAVEDTVLIDRYSESCAGQPLSLPSNAHATNVKPGGLDFELLTRGESRASPKLDAEKHQSEEGKGSMTSIINESESLFEEETSIINESESLFEEEEEEEKTNKRGSNPEILTQGNDKNVTNKNYNGLFEESIITSALPLKKFGTRSFLRSFMDSFDDNNGDLVVQHLNQNMKSNLRIFAVDSESEDSDQGSTENNLIYNSKVENVSITFDFCSSEPTAAEIKGTGSQICEKSMGAYGVLNQHDLNSNSPHAGVGIRQAEIEAKHQESVLDLGFRNSSNPFIVSESRMPVTDGSSVKNHHEAMLDDKEGHPNNPFVEVQRHTTDASIAETSPTMINQKKDVFNPFTFSVIESDVSTEPPESVNGINSNNPFVASEVENAQIDKTSKSNNQEPVLTSKIEQTSNPFASSEIQQPELKHKKLNSSNPFAISDIKTAEMALTSPNVNNEIVDVESFEASFSDVLGQVPDSGPVTSSGSTSVRSDSSSTSMRSFAFPVLQSEWNDSPEKFGKGKKGDFPKERGRWKQGAWRSLCCSGRLTG